MQNVLFSFRLLYFFEDLQPNKKRSYLKEQGICRSLYDLTPVLSAYVYEWERYKTCRNIFPTNSLLKGRGSKSKPTVNQNLPPRYRVRSCEKNQKRHVARCREIAYIKANSTLFEPHYNMSLVVRKPVFGVADQAPHKPGCTTTEDG